MAKLRFYSLSKADARITELEEQLARKTVIDKEFAKAAAPILAASVATNAVSKMDARFERAFDVVFGAASFESLKARSSSESDLRSRCAHRMYSEDVTFPGWEQDISRVEAKFGPLRLTGLAFSTAFHKREALQHFLEKTK